MRRKAAAFRERVPVWGVWVLQRCACVDGGPPAAGSGVCEPGSVRSGIGLRLSSGPRCHVLEGVRGGPRAVSSLASPPHSFFVPLAADLKETSWWRTP